MQVRRKKTTVGRLVKPVSDLQLPRTVSSRVPEVHPPKAVKWGVAAAGGLIGLTAGSAAVSGRRRRSEGSRRRS
jgi:hypothetical protein